MACLLCCLGRQRPPGAGNGATRYARAEETPPDRKKGELEEGRIFATLNGSCLIDCLPSRYATALLLFEFDENRQNYEYPLQKILVFAKDHYLTEVDLVK